MFSLHRLESLLPGILPFLISSSSQIIPSICWLFFASVFLVLLPLPWTLCFSTQRCKCTFKMTHGTSLPGFFSWHTNVRAHCCTLGYLPPISGQESHVSSFLHFVWVSVPMPSFMSLSFPCLVFPSIMHHSLGYCYAYLLAYCQLFQQSIIP